MEQSAPISSNTFWGPPFLEKKPQPRPQGFSLKKWVALGTRLKRPPKITEGGPFDPHWPIFRINPASGSMTLPRNCV